METGEVNQRRARPGRSDEPLSLSAATEEDRATQLGRMMWDFSKVTTIEYRGGYVFRVTFDDGAAGDVDFSDCLDLGPVFFPLRDLSYFRQARIEGGTIAWPNGADIAPETLCERVEAAESAHAPVARDKPATKPPRRRTRKP